MEGQSSSRDYTCERFRPNGAQYHHGIVNKMGNIFPLNNHNFVTDEKTSSSISDSLLKTLLLTKDFKESRRIWLKTLSQNETQPKTCHSLRMRRHVKKSHCSPLLIHPIWTGIRGSKQLVLIYFIE